MKELYEDALKVTLEDIVNASNHLYLDTTYVLRGEVQNSAEKKLKEIFGDCILHVSLSHERNNAIAVVIIEKK